MNPIPKPVAYMHRWTNGDPVVTFTPTLLGASDTQALYASPVVTPKDGWVLAPLTPTEVMIFAGVRQWDGTPADAYQIEVCKATYRAMLDAIDASPDAHDIRQINPDSLFANSINSTADSPAPKMVFVGGINSRGKPYLNALPVLPAGTKLYAEVAK